nr:unnamed protein product [Spirometra erinaceieuropaei]
MAGYPPPYGVPAVHYVPQTYYAAGYVPSAVQQTIPVPTFQPASSNTWVEHTSHDGRKYYYNTITKVTTWEKPDELKTAAERLLALCPWKEHKSESGKPYYYNTQTKQSVWTKPQELADAEANALSADSSASGLAPASLPSIAAVGTPITPATPSDDPKPNEPSAMEIAMKATLASIGTDKSSANSQDLNSSNIPLPPQNADHEVKLDLPPTHDDSRKGTSYVTETPPPPPTPAAPEYKTRGEMAEGLRQLFREKGVPGNATWEQALKLIGDDPRYAVLRNFVEKKQIFNVYKTQRQKEEREEQRMQAKQAKENLEKFLLQTKKIHSTMSYRKVDQVLSDVHEWTSVPDHDRRILFADAIQEIAKREKEEAKTLRKRNIKVFNEILNTMPNLTYRTTWSEAQQMLLDNSKFTSDLELQNLDKEDALICFEEHIRMLEREHDEEKEREKRKQKRANRKNREAFIVLLDELHERQLLTSTSLWKDLFSIINRDERFHAMLAQRGSTPLDLFKFYVESLKARFPIEKKLIKEILKETGTTVELSSSFDNFKELILADERGKALDLGNVRLTFNSLIEKAHGRETERQREEARRLRKQEQAFCEILRQITDPPIRADTPWEVVSERLGNHPAFTAITLESERIRVFKEYILALDSVDTGAGVYAVDGSKSRRSKAHKTRSTSREGDSQSELDARGDGSSRKDRSKRSRHRAASKSGSEDTDLAPSSKKKHKKTKSKSKKSKKYKSKHREDKNRDTASPPAQLSTSGASNSRSQIASAGAVGGGGGPDGELEEGEAADEDFEEERTHEAEEENGEEEEGEIAYRSSSSKKAHRHRQRQTPTPEDGEANSSLSEDEAYTSRSSSRRRRRRS